MAPTMSLGRKLMKAQIISVLTNYFYQNKRRTSPGFFSLSWSNFFCWAGLHMEEQQLLYLLSLCISEIFYPFQGIFPVRPWLLLDKPPLNKPIKVALGLFLEKSKGTDEKQNQAKDAHHIFRLIMMLFTKKMNNFLSYACHIHFFITCLLKIVYPNCGSLLRKKTARNVKKKTFLKTTQQNIITAVIFSFFSMTRKTK